MKSEQVRVKSKAYAFGEIKSVLFIPTKSDLSRPSGRISLKKARRNVLFHGCKSVLWTSRPPGYHLRWRLAVTKNSRKYLLNFLTAAEFAALLHLPSAAEHANSQRATLVGLITRRQNRTGDFAPHFFLLHYYLLLQKIGKILGKSEEEIDNK